MDREEYNSCVATGMKGKKLSKEERGHEFCVVAKLCSGKAGSREEADRICSEPKPPKEPKARRARGGGGGQSLNPKRVATCLVRKLEPDTVPNELDLANALSECL